MEVCSCQLEVCGCQMEVCCCQVDVCSCQQEVCSEENTHINFAVIFLFIIANLACVQINFYRLSFIRVEYIVGISGCYIFLPLIKIKLRYSK